MGNINTFNFLFTDDRSVGLYDVSVGDIYHSKFGALTEAWEKFILPINFEKNFINKKELKVLDICYGIGYNTKALLKKLFQTDFNGQVKIDAIEYNNNLVLLSPFIIDGFQNSIPEISYVLCKNLINNIYQNKDTLTNLILNNYKFIAPFYKSLIKKYKYWGYSYNIEKQNNLFLHNIYYHCISKRFKSYQNAFKNKKYVLNPYFMDARKAIKLIDSCYDLIFLDAFTPTKLPTLWTLDFFKELYLISKDDSILVTYSNSAAVRHAMIDAGYYVGKIFDKMNRPSGTIASKNIKFIKNQLNDFDLGLIETNAGIYFRDINLCSTPEEIFYEYNLRKKSLNLESSSHYIKSNKNKRETVQ